MFVYAVKHDGRHKARLVGLGNMTPVPVHSVYSSVASLRGVRIIIFIAELNKLKLWGTDIGNAYLESYTDEKVYVIARPEFGELEGHALVVTKALYGLRESGKMWGNCIFDVLIEMGFTCSKAEPDIWFRRVQDHYEYIAIYVDDLVIASNDPQGIIDVLEKKYRFKLKGTGEISFHLGTKYFRDEDGVLCATSSKYVKKMEETFTRLFGHKPQSYSSPLEKGDHPELDTSEELDANGIKLYQSLIGALQWAVQIGRIDIATAVMSMSSFRVAPRKGHLERIKHIYGYLMKMNAATIRFRTEEPYYTKLKTPKYDWERTAYRGAKELVPQDAPTPLGKPVVHTAYFDANLYHNMLDGRAVTGILHILNQTPIDWYTKKQSTVETATYGSEFIAARITVDQTIDIRTTLRYLGVPVLEPSIVFGDNMSVVNSSILPEAKLHRRHTMLSYHRVREAMAAKILKMHYIEGKWNPADILSKHWGYQQVWPQLQPLLFHKGDTAELLDAD